MLRSKIRAALPIALYAIGAFCTENRVHAQIIFDNLATSTQGYRPVTASTWVAQRFNTNSNTLQLTNVTLDLFSQSAGSGTFFLRLHSDAGGQPGTALATLSSATNPLPGPYPQSSNVSFNGLSETLTPNTNYWMVLGENPGAAMDLRWGVTNNGSGTGSGFQLLNASTPSQGAGWTLSSSTPHKMQLTAMVVPEPGSLLLLLVTGAGMSIVRRRDAVLIRESKP